MIGIIDYGLGNLISVAAAIEKLNYQSIITSDPEILTQAKFYFVKNL